MLIAMDVSKASLYDGASALALHHQAGKQGVSAVENAKRLLDSGMQTAAIGFPFPVSHYLLIEPPETEPKKVLDRFVAAMKAVHKEALSEPELVRSAPYALPLRRLYDESALRDLAWRRGNG